MVSTTTAPEPTTTGRRVVLDSAAALFESQGYAATSLRQIADAAGLRAASIYHHFDSKHELFATVLDEGITVMEQAFAEAAQAPNATGSASGAGAPSDRLTMHVRSHLGALFEHGPYTAVHVTAFFTSPPEVRASGIVRRDGYESLWNDLLQELLPHMDADAIRLRRLLLFGAMNTTIEWFDPSGDTTLDELAALITDQFLNGIAGASQ